MEKYLEQINVERKSGEEFFHEDENNLSFNLLDFWRWFGSDLINNTTRGFLAEFLVSKALGNIKQPRIEWNAYDASTKNGIKVEVKSASYIQTWRQKNFSKINFRIPTTKAWKAENNIYAEEKNVKLMFMFFVYYTTRIKKP